MNFKLVQFAPSLISGWGGYYLNLIKFKIYHNFSLGIWVLEFGIWVFIPVTLSFLLIPVNQQLQGVLK